MPACSHHALSPRSIHRRRPIAAISVAIVLLLSSHPGHCARALYDFEPAVVTLRGNVVVTPEHRPHGSADYASDPVENVEILHTQPFDVRAKPGDALNHEGERAVDSVQLYSDKFRGALHGCMDVSGTLSRAPDDDRHIKLRLDVSDARAADRCPPFGRERATQPHSFARPAQH